MIVLDLQMHLHLGPHLAQRRVSLRRWQYRCAATDALLKIVRRAAALIWARQRQWPALGAAMLAGRRRGRWMVIRGTPGAQLLPTSAVHAVDVVVRRTRSSAVFVTGPEQRLQPFGIEGLILARDPGQGQVTPWSVTKPAVSIRATIRR